MVVPFKKWLGVLLMIREYSVSDIFARLTPLSYRTILCVLFNVRVIAAACYVLAQRVIDGPHSTSLEARISLSSPSSSLPTPPSHKPTTPDGTRVVLEHFSLNEEDLSNLAGMMNFCETRGLRFI